MNPTLGDRVRWAIALGLVAFCAIGLAIAIGLAVFSNWQAFAEFGLFLLILCGSLAAGIILVLGAVWVTSTIEDYCAYRRRRNS